VPGWRGCSQPLASTPQARMVPPPPAATAPDALAVAAAAHGRQHHAHPLLRLARRARVRLGDGSRQALLGGSGRSDCLATLFRPGHAREPGDESPHCHPSTRAARDTSTLVARLQARRPAPHVPAQQTGCAAGCCSCAATSAGASRCNVARCRCPRALERCPPQRSHPGPGGSSSAQRWGAGQAKTRQG
jgi:hypothetical protein